MDHFRLLDKILNGSQTHTHTQHVTKVNGLNGSCLVQWDDNVFVVYGRTIGTHTLIDSIHHIVI